MSIVRAVLFDLGGTLIRTAPIPDIFMRILRKHGINPPLSADETDFPRFMDEMSLESFRLPYMEFWRIYNIKILKRLGVKGDLEGIADMITLEWWDNADLEVYPDVPETLSMLRSRGLKTGIVSNGFQLDIREVLSRTGLEGMFEVTVGVDDVGEPKPRVKIFHHALELLKIKPCEAIFVGDDPKADYEGAEAAGMKPILIDREGIIHGDYRRIRDLREIAEYL